MDTLLIDTQYENSLHSLEIQDDGTNVLRVLVYAMPVIFSLVGLRFIKKENSPIVNICTNMSIVATGFYIISMFTSGILMGRLPVYFSLYNYILLPWEIDHMFTKRSAQLVYLIMIGAYLIYYYYQLHFAWSII